MFRTLLTTTALIAATSMPAIADTATNTQAADADTQELVTLATSSIGHDDHVPMLASTITGTEVYPQTAGNEADAIATISDLIVSTDGAIDGVILSVGGVLNIGDTDVRVDWDDLGMERTEEGEPRITVGMTAEELEAMEPFVPFDERQSARAEGDDSLIETENEMAEQRADLAPAAVPAAVVRDDTWEMRDQYTDLMAGDVSAENLIGAPIYGANDENLGEIGDVLMSAEGEIDAVIVDFGGFLGIGEKPVAVQFDTVQLMRENASDNIAVFTGLTEVELENAATYDAETYGSAGVSALDAS